MADLADTTGNAKAGRQLLHTADTAYRPEEFRPAAAIRLVISTPCIDESGR
jgi:hypothetical protein